MNHATHWFETAPQSAILYQPYQQIENLPNIYHALLRQQEKHTTEYITFLYNLEVCIRHIVDHLHPCTDEQNEQAIHEIQRIYEAIILHVKENKQNIRVIETIAANIKQYLNDVCSIYQKDVHKQQATIETLRPVPNVQDIDTWNARTYKDACHYQQFGTYTQDEQLHIIRHLLFTQRNLNWFDDTLHHHVEPLYARLRIYHRHDMMYMKYAKNHYHNKPLYHPYCFKKAHPKQPYAPYTSNHEAAFIEELYKHAASQSILAIGFVEHIVTKHRSKPPISVHAIRKRFFDTWQGYVQQYLYAISYNDASLLTPTNMVHYIEQQWLVENGQNEPYEHTAIHAISDDMVQYAHVNALIQGNINSYQPSTIYDTYTQQPHTLVKQCIRDYLHAMQHIDAKALYMDTPYHYDDYVHAYLYYSEHTMAYMVNHYFEQHPFSHHLYERMWKEKRIPPYMKPTEIHHWLLANDTPRTPYSMQQQANLLEDILQNESNINPDIIHNPYFKEDAVRVLLLNQEHPHITTIWLSECTALPLNATYAQQYQYLVHHPEQCRELMQTFT